MDKEGRERVNRMEEFLIEQQRKGEEEPWYIQDGQYVHVSSPEQIQRRLMLLEREKATMMDLLVEEVYAKHTDVNIRYPQLMMKEVETTDKTIKLQLRKLIKLINILCDMNVIESKDNLGNKLDLVIDDTVEELNTSNAVKLAELMKKIIMIIA